MRADLRAQGPNLGLGELGAGFVQLGQSDLRGNPGGDLGDGPDWAASAPMV